MTTTLNEQERAALKRELFKGGIVSALFSLFKSRKKQAAARGDKYLLQDMANDAGVTKAQVSRWFNGGVTPNWRISTVYDIAEALDGDIRIEITDRKTGEVHTAQGVDSPVYTARTLPHAASNYVVYMMDWAAVEHTNLVRSEVYHHARFVSGTLPLTTTVGALVVGHNYAMGDRRGVYAA